MLANHSAGYLKLRHVIPESSHILTYKIWSSEELYIFLNYLELEVMVPTSQILVGLRIGL